MEMRQGERRRKKETGEAFENMVCAARSDFKRGERRNRDQEYIKSRGLKDSVGTEVER